MAVGGVVKEKKKKKKKIEEVEANDLLEDEGHKNDASVQTVVKNEFSEINIGGGDVDKDAPERKRKKKKKTKEMKQDVNGDILCHDASVQTTVKNEISKRDEQEGGAPAKKKKKMKEVESFQEEVVEEVEQMDGESKEKKRRKKLKTSVGEAEERKKKVVVETKEEQMVNLGHDEEMESKKKKKKKKRKTEDDVTELDDGKIKKKSKKNKEINVNTGETDACEGKEQQEKKKKKKEMKASKQTEEEKRKSPAEESSSSGEKKSKKLKKKLASLDQGHAPVKETTAAADDVVEMEAAPVEKKRSKRDVRNKSKDKVKKTKLKEEDQEPIEESANDKKTDVVFLSEKRGNRDEISIDQARRLALQRDIDQESQPKPGLGQWGSAQFESSDRQAKFLRLLGGFKKSSQPITGSSGSASMALGKEAQKTLQQGLLGEFERAQSRNVDFRNKGAGLGFTEPSNKKFTIDVNARNAIRFDD